ncbi:hypothetical protein [Alistipes sp. ZOR0009]|uniref:hypothetical protein n=1 Tax=Alistipes sp. ZOR0009 TaxID=1339253 RepID=UPI000645A17A|nr:hypothetical protein [Alistipes sp. ZOR0009]
MAMENHFSRTMMDKSDEELKAIVGSENEYSREAVMAAQWEIERRERVVLEVVEERIKEEQEAIGKTKSEAPPKVYSELFLIIFGVLFSVVGSGILIAMNLLQINRRQQAVFAVLFSFSFIIIQGVLLVSTGAIAPFISIPTSMLGVILIQRMIWEKEYPKGLPVVKRSPWLPLAIGIVLTALLMYLFYTAYGVLPGTMPAAK